jgi:hypothetical protein
MPVAAVVALPGPAYLGLFLKQAQIVHTLDLGCRLSGNGEAHNPG